MTINLSTVAYILALETINRLSIQYRAEIRIWSRP